MDLSAFSANHCVKARNVGGPIDELPDEITLHIILFGDLRSLARMARTSRQLHRLANDEALLRRMLRKHLALTDQEASVDAASGEKRTTLKEYLLAALRVNSVQRVRLATELFASDTALFEFYIFDIPKRQHAELFRQVSIRAATALGDIDAVTAYVRNVTIEGRLRTTAYAYLLSNDTARMRTIVRALAPYGARLVVDLARDRLLSNVEMMNVFVEVAQELRTQTRLSMLIKNSLMTDALYRADVDKVRYLLSQPSVDCWNDSLDAISGGTLANNALAYLLITDHEPKYAPALREIAKLLAQSGRVNADVIMMGQSPLTIREVAGMALRGATRVRERVANTDRVVLQAIVDARPFVEADDGAYPDDDVVEQQTLVQGSISSSRCRSVGNKRQDEQDRTSATLLLRSKGEQPTYVMMRTAQAVLIPSNFFKTKGNDAWNQELFTSAQSQLTSKVVPAGERIDFEVHADNDQYFFVYEGTGTVTVLPFNAFNRGYDHGQVYSMRVDPLTVVVVPAGLRHEVAADESGPLKLLSVYVPPHHPLGAYQRTKKGMVYKAADDEQDDSDDDDDHKKKTTKKTG